MKRKWPNTKIVSIMTYCAICNKTITKKNYEDDLYLCDECKDLSIIERLSKLYENILKIEIDYNKEDINQVLEYLKEIIDKED